MLRSKWKFTAKEGMFTASYTNELQIYSTKIIDSFKEKAQLGISVSPKI